MKEEHILEEMSSDSPSTASEKKRTAMSKLMTLIALLSFIYDAGFRNLAKKSDRRGGKYLGGLVDLVLVDPAYNVRRDRTDDHADCDVFRSNLVKDMVKVLGNLMKPGAHAHLFCFPLQLAFWHRILALEK